MGDSPKADETSVDQVDASVLSLEPGSLDNEVRMAPAPSLNDTMKGVGSPAEYVRRLAETYGKLTKQATLAVPEPDFSFDAANFSEAEVQTANRLWVRAKNRIEFGLRVHDQLKLKAVLASDVPDLMRRYPSAPSVRLMEAYLRRALDDEEGMLPAFGSSPGWGI